MAYVVLITMAFLMFPFGRHNVINYHKHLKEYQEILQRWQIVVEILHKLI